METCAFAEGCLSQSELTTSLPHGLSESAAQRAVDAARLRAQVCGVRTIVHTIGVIHIEASVAKSAAWADLFRPGIDLSWHAMAELVTPGQAEVLEPLMSIEEVAEVLRISQRGVYRLIGRGELPTVKIGGLTRIEPWQLKIYIAERRQLSEREPA